jgi:N-acetylglucosamine repressor
MVVVKVGHGIGAGIVLNGHLFQGDGFGAGEIGHITVVEGGLQCRCGNFGCLETVAGTHAVIKRAQALTHNGSTPRPESIEDIHRAFQAGDTAARQVVLEVGRYLGMAAANLVGTLNIRRIVFMTELAAFGTALLEVIWQEMRRRALPSLAHDTQVELIPLHPNAVILGASALLLTNELGLSLTR